MAAIILAGGQSSRMKGANKPLMKFKGQTMVGYLINKLETIFSDIIIAAKDRTLYQDYNVQVTVDDFDHQGPLSGMHAGLKLSSDWENFIIGCDMPLLNLNLVEYMLAQFQTNVDILVPRVGKNFEPLHAIYNKNCIPKIERAIRESRFKITDFWSELQVKYIEKEEIKRFDPEFYSFFNVNTRTDYNRALGVIDKLAERG